MWEKGPGQPAPKRTNSPRWWPYSCRTTAILAVIRELVVAVQVGPRRGDGDGVAADRPRVERPGFLDVPVIVIEVGPDYPVQLLSDCCAEQGIEIDRSPLGPAPPTLNLDVTSGATPISPIPAARQGVGSSVGRPVEVRDCANNRAAREQEPKFVRVRVVA